MTSQNDETGVAWRDAGSCIEGERFEIEGLNVWQHEWHQIPGIEAKVRDPLYGQSFEFAIYEIRTGEAVVKFAAGEYSPNVYGFWVPA